MKKVEQNELNQPDKIEWDGGNDEEGSFIVMEGTINGHEVKVNKFHNDFAGGESGIKGTIDGHLLSPYDAERILLKYLGDRKNIGLQTSKEASTLVDEVLEIDKLQ